MLVTCQCSGCGHLLNPERSSVDLEELQSCPACGLTANERAMTLQEDLIQLFSRNMNLQNELQTSSSQQTSQVTTMSNLAIGYSSSQHYYHLPAHLASNFVPTPTDPDHELKQILQNHGIDPSRLLSSQLELFRQAATDQQQRLVDLWKISFDDQQKRGGPERWMETSMAQGQELEGPHSQQHNATVTNSNQTQCDFVAISDERMDTITNDTDSSQTTEPYMKSGYEILSERDYNEQRPLQSRLYKHALDPAFSGREWWKDFITTGPMEHQFSVLEQLEVYRDDANMNRGDQEML